MVIGRLNISLFHYGYIMLYTNLKKKKKGRKLKSGCYYFILDGFPSLRLNNLIMELRNNIIM